MNKEEYRAFCKTPVSDPVAQLDLTVEKSSSQEKFDVIIKIGKTVPKTRDWWCRVSIKSDIELINREMVMVGANSLQALCLALSYAKSNIKLIQDKYKLKLFFEEENITFEDINKILFASEI